MRVLVLTNMYPPHHYGGYELACRAVVEDWRSRGHEVEVVTGDHRVADVTETDGPGVTRGLRFYWVDHELVRPPPWTRLAWERANHRLLTEVLDRFRPDVVSVWNHGTMSYALLATVISRRVPMALVVADNWLSWGPAYDLWTRQFADRGRFRALLGRTMTRLTGLPTRYPDLGREAVALFASAWLEDNVRRESRFAFERSAVVPWGIDEHMFVVQPEPRPRPWRGRLVFVGRVDERKGIFTVVRAVADLPGMELDIVGPAQPEELARLWDLADALGVSERVRVRELPSRDVPAAYRAADVALFPSEWGEPFGLVGLEAMACSTPLVATGTGGSGEYLRGDENCLLVPPGDPGALRGAIARLAADAELRERLVAGGETTASEYTLAAMSARLEASHESERHGRSTTAPL